MNIRSLSFRTLIKKAYFCHMEIKKSPRADLERGRGMRFVVALALVLMVVMIALHWKIKGGGDENPPVLNLADFSSDAILPPVMLPQALVIPEQVEAEVVPVDIDRIQTVQSVEKKRIEQAVEYLKKEWSQVDDIEEELIDLPEPVKETMEEFMADSLPHFPGGDAACMRFLSRHITYPSSALDGRRTGCVKVQFVVEKDGCLTGIQVVQSVSKMLDDEAVRVVKLMPKWNPGREKGKPARFLYVLPVDFRLR